MSDHSSHFDSISGTAINLGSTRSSERGVQKISGLAKEAREFQPGPTKDSTMTKPQQPANSEKKGTIDLAAKVKRLEMISYDFLNFEVFDATRELLFTLHEC